MSPLNKKLDVSKTNLDLESLAFTADSISNYFCRNPRCIGSGESSIQT